VNTLCPPDPGISATTMYRYNEFDKAFVANRAAQFRLRANIQNVRPHDLSGCLTLQRKAYGTEYVRIYSIFCTP